MLVLGFVRSKRVGKAREVDDLAKVGAFRCDRLPNPGEICRAAEPLRFSLLSVRFFSFLA
jgi:hypothetical protein